jgi:hypothetical protein
MWPDYATAHRYLHDASFHARVDRAQSTLLAEGVVVEIYQVARVLAVDDRCELEALRRLEPSLR